MSRRRLETAIQAGRHLEKGGALTEICDRADVYGCYKYEAVRDGIFCLQFSYDGSSLIVGYGDGGVELLSALDGKLIRELQRHRLGGLAVTCLRFCPQNTQLVYTTSCEGHVTAYDLSNNIFHHIATEPTNEIHCLDFNLEGSRFATAGRDLTVRIYDSQTNTEILSYSGYNYDSPEHSQEAGHAQRIFALRYHPEDNNIFVTGGWDNHLKIWDSRMKDGAVKTIHGPHICGDSLDIKGDLILTGSWVARDGLQFWDLGSGQLMETINLDHLTDDSHCQRDKQKGEFFYCAQFGGDDFVFAGGSGTKSVLVINIHTLQVVSEVKFGSTVQAVDNTENGLIFAAGGIGRELKLAKMI